jgi:hypothetical protein
VTQTASFYPPALAGVEPPADAAPTNLPRGFSISPEGGTQREGAPANSAGVSFAFNMTMPAVQARPAAPRGPVTGQTANPSAPLTAAIAAANVGEILRNGGTPVDIAVAMQVGNGRLGNGAAPDPSTAQLVQYNGATALGVAGGGGGDGGRLLLMPPEITAYVPPGGVASLPTLGQAFGGPEPALPSAAPPPPPTHC